MVKRWEKSRLAETQSSSREGLCSMELVTQIFQGSFKQVSVTDMKHETRCTAMNLRRLQSIC